MHYQSGWHSRAQWSTQTPSKTKLRPPPRSSPSTRTPARGSSPHQVWGGEGMEAACNSVQDVRTKILHHRDSHQRRNRKHLHLQTGPATLHDPAPEPDPAADADPPSPPDDGIDPVMIAVPVQSVPDPGGTYAHAVAGASRSLSGFMRSSVCMCLSCGWYPVFIFSAVDGILYSFLQLWTVSCIHFFKSNTIQHACACSYSQWMCQSSLVKS